MNDYCHISLFFRILSMISVMSPLAFQNVMDVVVPGLEWMWYLCGGMSNVSPSFSVTSFGFPSCSKSFMTQVPFSWKRDSRTGRLCFGSSCFGFSSIVPTLKVLSENAMSIFPSGIL